MDPLPEEEELLPLPVEDLLEPPQGLHVGCRVCWHPELDWRLFVGCAEVLRVYAASGILRVELRTVEGFLVDCPAKYVLLAH